MLKGRFRLSIRLDYTVVPVDILDLMIALQRSGAKVAKIPTIPAGSGAALEPVGGPIAQLGESVVDVDLSRGILGVEGPSGAESMSGFQKLLGMLQGDLGLDTQRHTSFVEFVCDLNIKGEKRAIEAMRGLKLSVATIAGKVLEESTSIFGLRLGSSNFEPDGPNWFDLRIEPLLRNPQVYFVSGVYRNKEVDRVLKIAENFESRIETIIASLEAETAHQIIGHLKPVPTQKSTARKSRS